MVTKPCVAISLATANGVPIPASTDTSVAAVLTMAGQNYPLQIHQRGHGSASQGKKPYKIKLNNAAPLLGMDNNRDWALMANALDHSFVNTALAMTIGNGIRKCLPWSPDSRFVELTLNGDNVGIYQLMQTVELSNTRVNQKEVDGDEEPGISGTYLMEINRQNYTGETPFVTPKGVSFLFDDPATPTPNQQQFIEGWLTTAEKALYDLNSMWMFYIDAPSFAAWYLIEELGSNQDSPFDGSVKVYKQQDTPDNADGPGSWNEGRLYFGPLWDFDISFGNTVNYAHPADGFFTRVDRAYWVMQAFNDPGFSKLVTQTWQALKVNVLGSDGERLDTLIDSITANIDATGAMARDQARWGYTYAADGNWSFGIGDDQDFYTQYPTKKAWCKARFAFMDKTYGGR